MLIIEREKKFFLSLLVFWVVMPCGLVCTVRPSNLTQDISYYKIFVHSVGQMRK
jgi:predicted permease